MTSFVSFASFVSYACFKLLQDISKDRYKLLPNVTEDIDEKTPDGHDMKAEITFEDSQLRPVKTQANVLFIYVLYVYILYVYALYVYALYVYVLCYPNESKAAINGGNFEKTQDVFTYAVYEYTAASIIFSRGVPDRFARSQNQ